MRESVLFVGTYEIPAGGVEAFHTQIAAMSQLVREQEPRVLFVGHYVNDDQTEGTSIHLHPDADSFDFHMAVASQVIDKGTQTVRVKRIEFYGQPSDAVVGQLSKVFDVRVKNWADGFTRTDW